MELSTLEKNLLKTPLAKLEVSLEFGPFKNLVDQVLREMRAKDLKFVPYFWISDEWFCPDGYAGVAVPFFILNRHVKALEKKVMGFVDGRNDQEILRILRHEIGHAMENAFQLKRHPLRVQTFGSHREPYPASFRPRIYSKAYVSYLGQGYAQSHPDEDFAETFAVWLDPESQWREKYGGHPALKKLLVMDQLMKSLRGQNSTRCRRGRISDISTMSGTLQEYYRRKRKYFRIQEKRKMAGEWGSYQLQKFIKDHKQALIEELSLRVGQPKYFVRQFIREISKDQSPRPESNAKRISSEQAFDLLVKGTRNYLEKGLDRVIL